MMAVEFDSFETNKKIIDLLIEQGVFTDWFLFAANCLRIVPPLVISEAEITTACNRLIHILNQL
jgi:acetylornithine/succinyldiaminopimelate/putrescine aminotransferase